MIRTEAAKEKKHCCGFSAYQGSGGSVVGVCKDHQLLSEGVEGKIYYFKTTRTDVVLIKNKRSLQASGLNDDIAATQRLQSD